MLCVLAVCELCRRPRSDRRMDRGVAGFALEFFAAMAPYATIDVAESYDTTGVSSARAPPFALAAAVCDRLIDVTVSITTPSL